MKKYLISIAAATLLLLTGSCGSEFLETHSSQGIDEGNIFMNTSNAEKALEGVYRLMFLRGSSQNYMGYETMIVMSDLMGEDLLFGASTTLFLQSYNWSVHRTITSAMMNYCYKYHYNIVANINTVLDNIDDADGPQADKDYIKGQAYAIRAAHYFNLVRMWGQRYRAGERNEQLGVPLIINPETASTPQPRATVEEVYQIINEDLDKAIELLENSPVRSNKIHPDRSVANGLKSRVLLTQGRWEEAAKYAKDARSTDEFKLSQTIFTEKPSRFCDQTNSEWMWGTKRIVSEDEGFSSLQVFFGNTDAITSRNGPKCIYNVLYHKISDTDKRKGMFAATKEIAMSDAFSRPQPGTSVPAYYNNKYMVPNHNSPQVDCPYMRVSEMYLNEAEGYARANRYAEAQQVLYDLIITRDPSYVKSTKTGNDLVEEILLHRRIELWGEGFRYFDLKRLNQACVRNDVAVLPDGSTQVSNHNASWAQHMEIPAGDKKWEYLFSDNELDNNPHIIQNEL
jgi:hypothetical protein